LIIFIWTLKMWSLSAGYGTRGVRPTDEFSHLGHAKRLIYTTPRQAQAILCGALDRFVGCCTSSILSRFIYIKDTRIWKLSFISRTNVPLRMVSMLG
jgi:hypothetical protein